MIQPPSAGSSGPIRSPFPPHGGEGADGAFVPARPLADIPEADPADVSSLDGAIAGAALIGLLLPGMLVPTTAHAEPTEIAQAIVVDTPTSVASAKPGGSTTKTAVASTSTDAPTVPTFLRTDDGSPVAVRLPAHPAAHYAETTPLVDAMLESDVAPAHRDALRRDLGVVPAPVLRKVVEDGTRFWVVPKDVNEVPARIFKNGRAASPTSLNGIEPAPPDTIATYQGVPFTASAAKEIEGINQQLAKHEIDGLYIPSQRLILVREETIPDPAPQQGRHRIALHELAHAVDSVLARDASYGPQHVETLNQVFADATAKGDAVFVTSYARTNATEHYADSFEAYFTVPTPDDISAQIAHIEGRVEPSIPLHDSNHDALLARDPSMHGLIAQDVGHAPRSAPAKPLTPP